MDNYGCIWNSFEPTDRCLDTVQYAFYAGVPVGANAVRVAKEVFDERGI